MEVQAIVFILPGRKKDLGVRRKRKKLKLSEYIKILADKRKGSKKMKKKIMSIMAAAAVITSLCSCEWTTQADRVNYNMSKEADRFNVSRRLSVINMRTDKPIFELVGNFSISNNNSNELVVTVETAANEYKKHYVYLNEYTMYVTVPRIMNAAILPPIHNPHRRRKSGSAVTKKILKICICV